jgi:hypothetical protein
VFAANPHRPTFNPYTQRPIYKNKRYLKHTNETAGTKKGNSSLRTNSSVKEIKPQNERSTKGVQKQKNRQVKNSQAQGIASL